MLETVYDLLQFDLHRYLLFYVFTPVAARTQCAYVKRQLEYVKRVVERALLQTSAKWPGQGHYA